MVDRNTEVFTNLIVGQILTFFQSEMVFHFLQQPTACFFTLAVNQHEVGSVDEQSGSFHAVFFIKINP